VTADQALVLIRDLAAKGAIAYTRHALDRMDQRGAQRADVKRALSQAQSCSYQAENDRWKVEGKDLDGDDLTVVVSIEADLIVVTVY
jgi:hypothetical protein